MDTKQTRERSGCIRSGRRAKEQMMTAKEIDAHIMVCPYFGGKNCIDRKIFEDGMTHIGTCRLEFHYRKVCPSEECICAEKFGLKGADDEHDK